MRTLVHMYICICVIIFNTKNSNCYIMHKRPHLSAIFPNRCCQNNPNIVTEEKKGKKCKRKIGKRKKEMKISVSNKEKERTF